MNDLYCSTKFTDLLVHIQTRLLYNCCKAYPERINLDWLEQNPGKLFHTPTMIQDRTEMLAGKRCKSCEWGCYKIEDKGMTSPRQELAKPMFINDVMSPLKRLQISLTNDCNLTCAYCSPEWSTAWFKDIEKNGEYEVKDVDHPISNWNKLYNKISQRRRGVDTKFFQLVLREIDLSDDIEQVIFLGGEPLLNNYLLSVMNKLKTKKITITTGLGVNPIRLNKFLDSVSNKIVEFDVSAESTGRYFEFIRYGCEWKTFKKNLENIKQKGFKVDFISTISNIGAFDLINFYKMYGHQHHVSFNQISGKAFLGVNVLDDESKYMISNSVKEYEHLDFFKKLIASMSQSCSTKEKKDLSSYLHKFAKRRGLSLEIFPKHFVDWLGIK